MLNKLIKTAEVLEIIEDRREVGFEGMATSPKDGRNWHFFDGMRTGLDGAHNDVQELANAIVNPDYRQVYTGYVDPELVRACVFVGQMFERYLAHWAEGQPYLHVFWTEVDDKAGTDRYFPIHGSSDLLRAVEDAYREFWALDVEYKAENIRLYFEVDGGDGGNLYEDCVLSKGEYPK